MEKLIESSSALSGSYPAFCEVNGKIPITFQGTWTVTRAVREVDHSQTWSALLIANAKPDFCECCAYCTDSVSPFESIAVYNS